jgi:hypothetical protein
MQTVTRDVKLARRHVGTRSIAALKRDAHKRERRAERMHTLALAAHVDPDAPRFARDDEPRCTSTTLEYAGANRPWEPTQCAYVAGHAASHCDGCVTWENTGMPLAQADEPRKRQPRPLTGWDLW